MDHANLVTRMAILLGEFLEAGTSPEALPQEAVHASHFGLEDGEEITQERLKPWFRGSLFTDIVHAINPSVCDVPKEDDGGMSWAHYCWMGAMNRYRRLVQFSMV